MTVRRVALMYLSVSGDLSGKPQVTSVEVSRYSTRRNSQFVVLSNVERIACKDHRTCVLKLNFHYDTARSMAWAKMQRDSLEKLTRPSGECLPI